jgi:hypothetical protein
MASSISFKRPSERKAYSDPIELRSSNKSQSRKKLRDRAGSEGDLGLMDIKKLKTGEPLEPQMYDVKYRSYFFRKDIIDRFQKEVKCRLGPGSTNPLATCKLYNSDEIYEVIKDKYSSTRTRDVSNPDYWRYKKEAMTKFIKNMSKEICGKDIGSEYIEGSFKSAPLIRPDEMSERTRNRSMQISPYDESYKYDILLLSTPDFEKRAVKISDEGDDENDENDEIGDNESDIGEDDDNDEEYVPKMDAVSEDQALSHRFKSIMGFIVVQLGECPKYPFSYTINIICTRDGAIPGSGSVLMGAYLYATVFHPDKGNNLTEINLPPGMAKLITTDYQATPDSDTEFITEFQTSEQLIPVQQIATLELASSYMNVGGLCMYEKFGFQYDPTMYNGYTGNGITCFEDFFNLPMKIDFNSPTIVTDSTTVPGYGSLEGQAGKLSKIVAIVAGADLGFPKSRICSIRGLEQKLLGALKTIRIALEKTRDPMNWIDQSYQTKTIYNMILSGSPTGRGTGAPLLANNVLTKIIDYISKLESGTTDSEIKALLMKIQSGGKKTRKYKRSSRTRKTKKLIKIGKRKQTNRNKRKTKRVNK